MRETDPAHRDGVSNCCRENLGLFKGRLFHTWIGVIEVRKYRCATSSANGCNLYPESQVVGRIVCFGAYWRQCTMRQARICMGGGSETSDTEITFCSHQGLMEGFSNSTHKFATPSNSKLDVITVTRAIGIVEHVVMPSTTTMSLQQSQRTF